MNSIDAVNGAYGDKNIVSNTAVNQNSNNNRASVFTKNANNSPVNTGEKPITVLSAEQALALNTQNRKVDGQNMQIKVAPDGSAYALNESSGKYELLSKVKNGNLFHRAQYARSQSVAQNNQNLNEANAADTQNSAQSATASSQTADTQASAQNTAAKQYTGPNVVTSLEPGENTSQAYKDVHNMWINNDDESFNKKLAQKRQETGNKNDYNYHSSTTSAADLKKIFADADRAWLNDFFGKENMRNMTGDDTSLLDKADDTKFLLTYQAISAERTGTPMQVDIEKGTIRMLDARLLG